MSKKAISEKLEKTIKDIEVSVTNVVNKFDELKELIQKNVNENLDKIKEISQTTQSTGKKYVDSVLTLVPFKELLDKFKNSDHKELALTIKNDLEKRFNVGIDQILNAFNIASTADTKEIIKRLESIEKELKDLQKSKKETKKPSKKKPASKKEKKEDEKSV